MEDAGLKPGADRPASATHRGEGLAAGPRDTERLRCPRCGERDDLLVRIDSLARLVRGENPDGLSLDLASKSPGDYTWRAIHCGRCGSESARDDFEEPAVAAMRSALEAAHPHDRGDRRLHPARSDCRLPATSRSSRRRPSRPAGDPDWLDLATPISWPAGAGPGARMVRDSDDAATEPIGTGMRRGCR